ncbi:MAG: ABC transporter ATP-binding protein [Candidatus Zixiibacteriota bacterium]
MSTLDLNGLTKDFGVTRALDDIHLRVGDGDFCVLLGPSGCGKSTALRCIAGLEQPTAGEIRMDGVCVNDQTPKERGVAMVFQSYALYPHMTVRENLAFPLKMAGRPKDEIGARVGEVSSLLRIDELLGRRPRELSGGQRQRVAIGRAIVRNPRLFLFDEPLSNLDARLRNEMRLEIAALHRRLQNTVIYVTHDQIEALTLGKTIVVMNQGRIEQIGAPEEIYNRPASRFVAGFVGMPPMNFAPGSIRSGVFEAYGLRTVIPLDDLPGVEIGIRPEDLRIRDEPGPWEVALIEDLGSDRYAHIELKDGGLRWAVRLPRDWTPGIGVRVAINPDDRKVHVFRNGRRVDFRHDQDTGVPGSAGV